MPKTTFEDAQGQLQSGSSRLTQHPEGLYPLPVTMLSERFTREKALIELLQNHVDAGRRAGRRPTIQKRNGVWEISDEGEGYDSLLLQLMYSHKRDDIQTLHVGRKATGGKKAALQLLSTSEKEPITVVYHSRDWVSQPRIVPFGTSDNPHHVLGIPVIQGLSHITGSRTSIYNLPSSLEHVLEHPERYFLDFRGEHWKPWYIAPGQHWSNLSGIDSIIAPHDGQVWIRGAYVNSDLKDRLLCSYNFNSILAPDDDDRTTVDTYRVESSILHLLGSCYDSRVIDHILTESRMDRKGATQHIEWDVLDSIVRYWKSTFDIPNLAASYQARFRELFSKNGRRVVLHNPSRDGVSEPRVTRTLERLQTDVVSLNPTLTHFLHECGIPYDTQLTVDFENLITSVSHRELQGEIQFVDNYLLRAYPESFGLHQTIYGVLAHHQSRTQERPQVQFLVTMPSGETYWVSSDSYAAFVSEMKLPNYRLQEAQRTLLEEGKHRLRYSFGVPGREIGGIPKEQFFSYIHAIRIITPTEQPLKITDLGEVEHAEEPLVQGQRTPETALLTRLFASHAGSNLTIGVRAGNFFAVPSQRIDGRCQRRRYLEAYLGLQDEHALQGKMAVQFASSDPKLLPEILDVLYNLESHALAYRPGYRPVFSGSTVDIVTLDDNGMYRSGLGGYQDLRFVLGYNFKQISPLSQVYSPEESVRSTILECKNLEVYRKLAWAASQDHKHDCVELCDYVRAVKVYNEEHRLTSLEFDDDHKRLFREAFYKEYGDNAVIAVANRVLTQNASSRKSTFDSGLGPILGSFDRGSTYILSELTYRAGNFQEGLAELLGNRVCHLQSEFAQTLVACGVRTDLDAIAEDCTYVPVRELDSQRHAKPSASTGPATVASKTTDKTIERSAFDRAKKLVEIIGTYTHTQYEVVVFDHIQNSRGQDLDNFVNYANKRTPQGTTIYVHRSQLQNQEQMVYGIMNVALTYEQTREIAMRALCTQVQNAPEFSSLSLKDIFGSRFFSSRGK